MTRRDQNVRKTLEQDLADLKLFRIVEIYKDVLDEGARKGSTPLQLLATLIAAEAAARDERALQRRIQRARLPKMKVLEEYDFTFPKRVPKQTILRFFDCDFVSPLAFCQVIAISFTSRGFDLHLGHRADASTAAIEG